MRACIFCGATDRKLTNEHLLPKAVRDAFPELKTSKFYRQPSGAPQVESWEAPSFEQRVRVVCEQCNNTWMSGIEKDAAPLLFDLVRPGKSIVLDAFQQRRLAAWGYLKAVLLQFTGRGIVVPDAHRGELFRLYRPPMKSLVWLAAYNRAFALTTCRASGGNFNPPGTGDFYVLTWSVGTLAFHIFGHTAPATYGLDLGDFKPWLNPLWPAGGLVTWPPEHYFDDAGIGHLHESLRADVTDDVRAVRERGIAAFIRSSIAGKRSGS